MIVRALVAAYATRHQTSSPSPRPRSLRRIGAALAVAVAVSLGAAAAPALAARFTLNLAPPSEAVVGRPLIIQATGTVPPPGEIALPYWFSLDAIPAAVTTTCPADRWEGAQFANATGGSVVVLSQSENPDTAGNFTIPVAVTPLAPGSVLLCAYTDDGGAITLAGASLMLDIEAAASRRPSPPEYAAEGIRSCRALLTGSDARSCIRKIVRKANARCRRLPSQPGRTRCLRAVRRADRRDS